MAQRVGAHDRPEAYCTAQAVADCTAPSAGRYSPWHGRCQRSFTYVRAAPLSSYVWDAWRSSAPPLPSYAWDVIFGGNVRKCALVSLDSNSVVLYCIAMIDIDMVVMWPARPAAPCQPPTGLPACQQKVTTSAGSSTPRVPYVITRDSPCPTAAWSQRGSNYSYDLTCCVPACKQATAFHCDDNPPFPTGGGPAVR